MKRCYVCPIARQSKQQDSPFSEASMYLIHRVMWVSMSPNDVLWSQYAQVAGSEFRKTATHVSESLSVYCRGRLGYCRWLIRVRCGYELSAHNAPWSPRCRLYPLWLQVCRCRCIPVFETGSTHQGWAEIGLMLVVSGNIVVHQNIPNRLKDLSRVPHNLQTQSTLW